MDDGKSKKNAESNGKRRLFIETIGADGTKQRVPLDSIQPDETTLKAIHEMGELGRSVFANVDPIITKAIADYERVGEIAAKFIEATQERSSAYSSIMKMAEESNGRMEKIIEAGRQASSIQNHLRPHLDHIDVRPARSRLDAQQARMNSLLTQEVADLKHRVRELEDELMSQTIEDMPNIVSDEAED